MRVVQSQAHPARPRRDGRHPSDPEQPKAHRVQCSAESLVVGCLAQEPQFICGQVIGLLLPDGLVDDPWNQHDAWASGQPGESGQRFEPSAGFFPHDFIRVVDGLPKIENEAFASLQA